MFASRTHESLRIPRCWLKAAAMVMVSSSVGCSSPSSDSNGYKIGLLLPYTGSSSGTSANFERSVIYAVDRVNDSGGVHGNPIRLVAADTHSSVARSATSVRQLVDDDVLVVIGPESADVADEIAPTLKDAGVAFLSPLVGAADDSKVTCSDLWFRLAPSARTLGEALAKQITSEQTVILHEAGGYNEALRDAVRTRLASLGRVVLFSIELDPTAQSYTDTVERVLATGVTSIVLATSPRTGALVVNEFSAATRRSLQWYLSPLLKTDLLVKNVAPSALDAAIGVAPMVYETGKEFPDAFRDRWEGDLPLEGAYFYYDALALVAYALQMAEPSETGRIDPDAFKAAVLQAARAGGEPTTWSDIELGLEQLRDDADIYYSGLTGPMLLDNCGARRKGAYSVWTVSSGRIATTSGI